MQSHDDTFVSGLIAGPQCPVIQVAAWLAFFHELACRPPLASCRRLCSTAIALLLVILVRSLRNQGWRDLRRLDRGALLHGGGTFPFDRRWGRSYFYAPSVAYDRTFPIFAGVAATMRG